MKPMVLLLLVLTFGSAIPETSLSQNRENVPTALLRVRDSFAAAVLRHDAKGAAQFIRFPLDNRVYQEPPRISQREFPKTFAEVYIPNEHCLAKARLEIVTPSNKLGGSLWEINCDGNSFHFGKEGGRWFHTGYENVNE